MLGISIYSQSYDLNYLKELKNSNINDVFISLHIPEELNNKSNVENFLSDLKALNFNIIADVSPLTLEVFSKSELKDFNISTLRIDFGYTFDEIIMLGKDFKIVLNASTLDQEELEYLQENGFDLSKMIAMHNFYPKPETGLDVSYYQEKNKLIRKFGMTIYGFVPGDLEFRGPLHQGLPTLEHHRNQNIIVSYLEMQQDCDLVFIGDIKISDQSSKLFEYLNENITPIIIKNNTLEEKFLNVPLTIRRDSNHLVLRIEESRVDLKATNEIEPNNSIARKKGTITIDNKLLKRYNGEVMIILQDLEQNEASNVVANIIDEHINVLDYINRNNQIIFLSEF